jgi:3-methyladenine DNA glycosylase/8-oxoguanine DNA glycosylase
LNTKNDFKEVYVPAIQTTQLTIKAPAPFDFEGTAYSHGWSVLAPNAWEKERQALRRVHRLGSGAVVLLDIQDASSAGDPEMHVVVHHGEDLDSALETQIRGDVARMFRIEEDLSEFYELCGLRGGQWVRLTGGLGRLLRSPTLFEDVVKTILTTNIQWGGTKRMVNELIAAYGESYTGDETLRAFPTPESIAAVPETSFAASVRLGYRGPYIYNLARQVVSGELQLEALAESDLPTPELKKELLAIKGVGPYAAATLLMLLGRYDELAVDTEFRKFVSEKYFEGQWPGEQQAMAVYEDWGCWKYLAFWFDIYESAGE